MVILVLIVIVAHGELALTGGIIPAVGMVGFRHQRYQDNWIRMEKRGTKGRMRR